MIENIPLISVGVAAIGLLIAFMLYKQINKIKISNPTVADITKQIQDGAMAFLKAEYRYLSIFIVVVAGLLLWNNGQQTALAFLAGATAASSSSAW